MSQDNSRVAIFASAATSVLVTAIAGLVTYYSNERALEFQNQLYEVQRITSYNQFELKFIELAMNASSEEEKTKLVEIGDAFYFCNKNESGAANKPNNDWWMNLRKAISPAMADRTAPCWNTSI